MLSRHRRRPQAPLPVGWLFADLFLVLFTLALAAVPTPSPAAHAKAVTGSHLKSAKKPGKGPSGVESTPTDICVSQALSGQGLVAAFDQQVKLEHLTGHKAGFIIVFATGSDIASSITAATDAFQDVKNNDPDRAAFSGAGGEGLWGGTADNCAVNGGTNNYHFQIFFYLGQ
jgi:hypothetical protein